MTVEPVSIAERMRQARLQTGANRRAAVSQDEMAALVSKALGRVIRQTQWGRYETGSEPPLDVIRATATVSGIDERYLAFGDIDGNVKPGTAIAFAQSQRKDYPPSPIEEPDEDFVPPETDVTPIKRAGGANRRGRRRK